MPTPFMHLEVAERILAHKALGRSITRKVTAELPAFYLGNVAADYQTIADTPRETTHFYKLPPERDTIAHARLLECYPRLAAASSLNDDHAVFIAAYRAHLLLDLRWYWEVLVPFFVEAKNWPADHRQRFLVHNTLLTYLDKMALESLPSGTAQILDRAEPDDWLPFASDGDLIRWRDMLVRQLQPGARIETVTIYARRMKMTPEAFAANLEDPHWMQEHVFRKVPLRAVHEVISAGVDSSVTLIADYLSPAIQE